VHPGTLHRLCLAIGLLLACPRVLSQAEPQAASAGTVETLVLHSKVFANTRTIRVWLPPEYHKQVSRNYPVFYFTDGVAAFQGRRLDRIAATLTAEGKIPPTIFVGIDNGGSTRESKHPGTDRANEYLPYPDGFLKPPLPVPHGNLFPKFLETEVRPLVESRYRTSGGVGLAGASYGGAVAVYTAIEKPGQFKWLLIESPSLYIGNGILKRRATEFSEWPERVYVGAGTNEGEGDAKREMVDDASEFVGSLRGRTTHCFVLEAGAGHGEDAWRARLPIALGFLLGKGACPEARKATQNNPASAAP
jgi:enterochelin esterase-like enzyme